MSAKDKNQVSVILSGIGGYGYYYLKSLLEDFSVKKDCLAIKANRLGRDIQSI